MKKFRKLFSGVYWWYILAFSAIVMFIIIAMGSYLYKYYYNTIYNDFVASNKDYLSAVVNQHENNIAHIINISYQMSLSNTISPFRLEEQSVKSIQLKKQLKTYQVISQFFHQIFLIFDIDEYLYSGDTSVYIERFVHESFVLHKDSFYVLYSMLRNPEEVSVLKEQEISGILAIQQKAVLYALPLNKKGTLLYVVGGSYYDTLLHCDLNDLRSNYILKDNSIIVSRGNLRFADFFIEETLTGRPAGFYEIQTQDGKFLFTIIDGESGFRYCTIQSMTVFQNKILSEQWNILFFIAILIIPAAIVITVLSKNLQKPLGAVRAMFLQDGEGDDLEVIKKGIRELVGHNLILKEIVEESLSIRRSEVIRNFVKGVYQSRDDFLTEAGKVDLSLDKKYFAVVLCGRSQQIDEKPLIESLQKLFSIDGEVTGHGFEMFVNNQTLFVFFSNDQKAISDFAVRFADMGRTISQNFVMAISNIHEDYKQVSSAYLEANAAYDSRFIMGVSDILHFDDIASIDSTAQFPQVYMEALKNALRLGNKTSAYSVIDEIFRYLRSIKQSLFAFRVLYNDIISVLISEWKPDNSENYRLYDVFTLSQCLSIQDLDNMLRSVCEALLSNKQNTSENIYNKMQEAAAYMRDNYSNADLNMNMLADYLSVSTVTLSVEFKKFMGMSPSDYLTLLRIERTKELLRESSLTIKEICSAVGYTDVPGFIRRFKRYTAQTPAQFRRTYANMQ